MTLPKVLVAIVTRRHLLPREEPRGHSSAPGAGAGTRWPPAWPDAELQRSARPRPSSQRTAEKRGVRRSRASSEGHPRASASPHLGSVPVLRLLHVGRGHGLVLEPDVSQSSGQVRFGHVQVHVNLLGCDQLLQLTQFLEGGGSVKHLRNT